MSSNDELVLCPLCREQNRADAISCWFCKFVFPPRPLEIDIEDAQAAQLEAFRTSFIKEIPNILSYTQSISDALGLIVNVLGTTMAVSRCQIYCTYDGKSGWHYSEYCRKEFPHSKTLGWLPSKSALIARAVLAPQPLSFADMDAANMPKSLRNELGQLQIKSALAVALPPDHRTKGCLIMHQCDTTRHWTDDEFHWAKQLASALSTNLSRNG